MWKDKGLQLVMLPTKEETSLIIDDNSGLLHKLDNPKEAAWGFQYLYLLSDEEIKAGDWFIGKDLDGCNYVLKCDSIKDAYCYTDNKAKGGYGIVKKIIASNNPSNLPQFPSSFLEEYVKRYNSKKSLEVEVDCNELVWQQSSDRYYDNDVYCNGEKVASFDYRLQEEEMDRFTDRLGKQPKINSDNTISIRFKEEKMYSRSEVEELCGKAFDAGEAYRTGSCEGFKQIHPDKYDWIKENLK